MIVSLPVDGTLNGILSYHQPAGATKGNRQGCISKSPIKSIASGCKNVEGQHGAEALLFDAGKAVKARVEITKCKWRGLTMCVD